MGFGIQRFRPLGEQTLAQLAGLVVGILLPFYLFFTTATEATPEAPSAAPLLIVMGVAVTLLVDQMVARM
jgi:predicted permease